MPPPTGTSTISRSKMSSSSVLSSEGTFRPAVSFDSDDGVFFFASKLRPINVRSRWTSGRMVNEDYQKDQTVIPPFSGIPETISLELIPNNSFRVSADDLEPIHHHTMILMFNP